MRAVVAVRVARWLPDRVRAVLRNAVFRGTARYCPLCGGRFRIFLRAGVADRADARCPACGSLERHRLAALLLERERLPGTSGRVLHLAPEPCMLRLVAAAGVHHVTADLCSPDVDERLDLTALPHPDGCFQLVYCSHVLEHVSDDRAAMREMARVLAVGGLALIQVPVSDRETTAEDAELRSPEDRLRTFGQEDHVRIYGQDLRERLTEAGFEVTALHPRDVATPEDVRRMRLDPDEGAYLCRRRAG